MTNRTPQTTGRNRGGPLAGIRIVELAGIGPGPFCGMMLADHGAEVIRIDRGGGPADARDPLLRSRRSVALDLKRPAAVAAVRRIVRQADGLIEGFRPGVAERLGLGPDVLLGDNPRLVYGRMTGWGQDGPMAREPGHDINYLALSGALHAFGRAGERPTPPINAAAGCCWRLECWPPFFPRSRPGGARWWTPPWWTARHC